MDIPAPLSVCLVSDVGKFNARPLLAEAITLSPLLDLSPEPSSEAIRVVAKPDNVFQIYEPDQEQPLASYKIKGNIAKEVMLLLEHLAAFRNLSRLPAPANDLSGKLKVRFGQLLRPADRRQPPQYEPLVPDEAHGEVALKAGQNLVIVVTNPTERPVYVYVVALNALQRSASRLYPYGDASVRLKPTESVAVGSGPDYLITLDLPPGCRSGLDPMKVFLSHASIDLEVLSIPEFGKPYRVPDDQFGTGSRLDLELRCWLSGQPLPPGTSLPESDLWTLVEQSVRVRAY